MDFSSMIKRELILDSVMADDSLSALSVLSRFMFERGYVESSFEQAILDRERAHPSGLPMEGHKIAIPHTNAEHVKESAILFARLSKPVEFRCMGDPSTPIQVQLISMFALKEAKKIGDLLEALIGVYRDHQALDEILNAADSDEIFRILTKRVEAAVGKNPT